MQEEEKMIVLTSLGSYVSNFLIFENNHCPLCPRTKRNQKMSSKLGSPQRSQGVFCLSIFSLVTQFCFVFLLEGTWVLTERIYYGKMFLFPVSHTVNAHQIHFCLIHCVSFWEFHNDKWESPQELVSSRRRWWDSDLEHRCNDMCSSRGFRSGAPRAAASASPALVGILGWIPGPELLNQTLSGWGPAVHPLLRSPQVILVPCWCQRSKCSAAGIQDKGPFMPSEWDKKALKRRRQVSWAMVDHLNSRQFSKDEGLNSWTA